MIPKPLLIALAILGLYMAFGSVGLGLAQSPCDNPYPDSCRVPDTCCAMPMERCPWQYNGLDVTYMVAYFKGGPRLMPPYSKYDVNCNCVINGMDVMYIVDYFKGVYSELKCCFYQCRFHPQTGVIGDRVWLDSNANGLQDTNEIGIAGAVVQLTDCADPPHVLLVDTTNANGFYSFDTLNSGNYRVRFLIPEGYHFTLQDQGSNDQLDSDADRATGFTECFEISVNESDLSWDAGFYIPGNLGAIGDRAWFDFDQDGIQDPGEEGFAHLPVELLDCSNPPRVLATDTTDENGRYLFSGLPAGNYRVHFWHTDEFYYSPMDQGDNDQLDSDVDRIYGTTPCIEISNMEIDTSWDMGMYWPYYHGGFGDLVWNDENRNGIQDPGEPGLPGITVVLYDCDSLFQDSTVTDSNGHYIFAYLGTALAFMHFILPDGYEFSPQNQGSNDSLDSDINPETGNIPCVEVPEGPPVLTWDAGMFREEEGCTWQLAWWKNHAGYRSQPDSVSRYLPLWLGFPDSVNSINVTTNQIAIEILRIQGGYGHAFNSITRLYAQLLATKLNIQNGASDEDIVQTIGLADAFLATHNWHDWVRLNHAERELIWGWILRLAAFNNGWIGPGRCHREDADL